MPITDLGIQLRRLRSGQVPANSVVINNFNLVANDINPVTYTGLRVEALYRFNEDWNALLAQSYQNMEADGVFAEMAANSLGEPLPDLSVQLYNPSYDKDKFENTALTIDGRVGALKLVYAGAYLVRNVEQVQDYTNYARGTVRGLLSVRKSRSDSCNCAMLHAQLDLARRTSATPTRPRSCA